MDKGEGPERLAAPNSAENLPTLFNGRVRREEV